MRRELSPRQAEVIKWTRKHRTATYAEIGKQFSISRQRVFQILNPERVVRYGKWQRIGGDDMTAG